MKRDKGKEANKESKSSDNIAKYFIRKYEEMGVKPIQIKSLPKMKLKTSK